MARFGRSRRSTDVKPARDASETLPLVLAFSHRMVDVSQVASLGLVYCSFGGTAPDVALVREIVQQSIGEQHQVVGLEGGTFAALLVDTSLEQTYAGAERARAAVAAHQHGQSTTLYSRRRLAVGVAWAPRDGNPGLLFEQAVSALHDAERTGDTVVIARDLAA